MVFRSIFKTVSAKEISEGVGATVRRSIGVLGMRNFTPFLMLDHFNGAATAGFPDHPHRGQETVTLVMKNYVLHEDFTGKKGILRPGDLQFMTAGRGIVHSEMLYAPDGTNVEGLQLWVDLPKELRHSEPRYRDLRAEEIPVVKPNDKVQVKVISGKSYGVESVKELAYTPMDYYWFTVLPGGEFTQEINPEYNGFMYVLQGYVELQDGGKFTKVEKHHSVFFQRDGNLIRGRVPFEGERTEFVLISGKALDQPIFQYGPFVESSKTGIHNALYDYQMGMNGFENAKSWFSDIGGGVNEQMFKERLEHIQNGLKREEYAKQCRVKKDDSFSNEIL